MSKHRPAVLLCLLSDNKTMCAALVCGRMMNDCVVRSLEAVNEKQININNVGAVTIFRSVFIIVSSDIILVIKFQGWHM